MTDFDLAVVGAGPVGVLAAALLAERGLQVLLLDADEAAVQEFSRKEFDLRVVALAPGAQQILSRLGAWPAEVAARAQPYAAMEVWDASGPGRIRFDADPGSSAQLGHIIEVPLLQAALNRLAPAGLTRWQSARLQDIEFGRQALELRTTDGRQMRVRAVLGADGRRSRLRQIGQFSYSHRDYQARGVVALLHCPEGHGQIPRQAFTSDGPLGLLPLPDGRLSMVWSVSRARAEELLSADDTAFAAAISQASGLPELSLLRRPAAFDLELLHCETYAQDGIVLLGDAAHVVHPLAGLGMNLGLADAASLAARVAADQAEGRDPLAQASLARWARARRAQVQPAVAWLETLERLFASQVPGVVALRDLGLNLVDRQAMIKGAFMAYAITAGH